MSIDDIAYDRVHQKSIHNAYQRTEGILDQMLYWGARSMEIDLHTEDPLGNDIEYGDWAVFHHKADPESAVHRLSQVLEMLVGFHKAVPDHEVITVFLDMVDPLPPRSDAAHSFKRLDKLLTDALGDAIFTPDELISDVPGAKWARTAVRARGWPTLKQLRGRFIFCLTGKADNYAQTKIQARNRVAFVATYLTSPDDLGIDLDRVFYNVNAETSLDLLDAVDPDDRFVTRAFYADEVTSWSASIRAKVNHIATDMVNDERDEWSSTRNELGFPFARIAGDIDGLAADWDSAAEATTGFEVWSRGKDVVHRRGKDEFGFVFDRFEGSDCDRTMEYLVAGPHSHVDGDVCGALVVRSGSDGDGEPGRDDAFMAILRRGARRPLEVAFRAERGGRTIQIKPEFGSVGSFGRDINLDTIAFLRLEVEQSGRRVTASASHDGEDWRELKVVEFDEPMQLQGVGVSSAGERGGVRYLFVPLTDTDPQPFDQVIGVGGAKVSRSVGATGHPNTR